MNIFNIAQSLVLYDIFKQEIVGWESSHCGKTVQKLVFALDDFIVGVVCLCMWCMLCVSATVWRLQHEESDTVQSLSQAVNSALFSTGQDRTSCNTVVTVRGPYS